MGSFLCDLCGFGAEKEENTVLQIEPSLANKHNRYRKEMKRIKLLALSLSRLYCSGDKMKYTSDSRAIFYGN